MSTSNELFRDILLQRQIALARYERGLQKEIIALLDKTERALRIELTDRLTDITGRSFNSAQHSRLRVLANAIEKIRADAFDASRDMWDGSMRQLVVDEVAYLDKNLKEIVPVKLDTVLPTAEQLVSLVRNQPIKGRVLAEWATKIREADQTRIMDAVKIGVASGENSNNIIRRVMGTRSLDGTDGALELARRDAAAITQTAISTMADAARSEYFEENNDIFETEVWVATLDDATCEECGALDGQEFELNKGEHPPLHFNCRCVRVPTIGGKLIGSRPSNPVFKDELEGLTKDERRTKIAELVGQVPATTKYSDWLSSQSEKFQDHVLGPTRAALFRDGGLSLDRFTNARGDSYTLDQLRKLEPEAFRKAGF